MAATVCLNVDPAMAEARAHAFSSKVRAVGGMTASHQGCATASNTRTTAPGLARQHMGWWPQCTAPQRAGGSAVISVTVLLVSTCGDQVDGHGARGVAGPEVDVKGKAAVLVRGVGRACTSTHSGAIRSTMEEQASEVPCLRAPGHGLVHCTGLHVCQGLMLAVNVQPCNKVISSIRTWHL